MTQTRAHMLVAADGRKSYYKAAAAWTAEVHNSLRGSRRGAWVLAAIAVLAALLEAAALAGLFPLETAVPYVVSVDRQEGYAQTVMGLKPGFLSQDPAITQSFVAQYVLAREAFDSPHLRHQYREAMLWSSGDVRSQFQQELLRSTPDSPLNLYAPKTQVDVTIKSVSLLSATTALVRFDTMRRDVGLLPGPIQTWAAVLTFHYSDAPMLMADRFLNPLGFQVTEYRRETDTAVYPATLATIPAPASASVSISPEETMPLTPLGASPRIAAPPPDSTRR